MHRCIDVLAMCPVQLPAVDRCINASMCNGSTWHAESGACRKFGHTGLAKRKQS